MSSRAFTDLLLPFSLYHWRQQQQQYIYQYSIVVQHMTGLLYNYVYYNSVVVTLASEKETFFSVKSYAFPRENRESGYMHEFSQGFLQKKDVCTYVSGLSSPPSTEYARLQGLNSEKKNFCPLMGGPLNGHSSEKRELYLMKYSSQMLHNFCYIFEYKYSYVGFLKTKKNLRSFLYSKRMANLKDFTGTFYQACTFFSEECADDDEIVVIPCKNSSGDTNLISYGSANTPQSNK